MTRTAKTQMARNASENKNRVSSKAKADRLREYSRRMRAANKAYFNTNND